MMKEMEVREWLAAQAYVDKTSIVDVLSEMAVIMTALEKTYPDRFQGFDHAAKLVNLAANFADGEPYSDKDYLYLNPETLTIPFDPMSTLIDLPNL